MAAAVLTLASCQKNLHTVQAPDAQFQHEIALKSATGLTKSASNGTSFPVGYDMLVSAYRNVDASVAGEDVAANYFKGIHFAKVAEKTVWKEGKYWPLSGNLDFLCIASAGLNTAGNGIVPTCAWDSDNVASEVVVTVPDNSVKFDDLLYGAANAQTYVAAGNPVVFKHAMAAVVFTAKSNVAYDNTKNTGITIDKITIDNAKYGGTLTVTNGGAAAGSGNLTAAWSALGSQKDHIQARVWNTANLGTNSSESALSALNLTATSATLAAKPFGEAYVILPAQPAAKFTVTYTIHNGKDASGSALNNQMQYQYTPAAGNWDMAKKYVYDINITLNEITIAPSVTNWVDQGAVNVPINQEQPE